MGFGSPAGCAIQTGAVHIAMLIVGRFIAGVSIGVLSMIVPVYQAEISPPVRFDKGSSGHRLTNSTHEDCSLVGRSS